MTATMRATADPGLSLFRLLDPDVLADPYPLYARLRSEDPVHWDPYLHVWVVTRYRDVVHVLTEFSARRAPTPEELSAVGLSALGPVARMMLKQMLFMDAPDHGRLRSLAAQAFTPQRIARLRAHIQDVADRLLDHAAAAGRMDVIADLAEPLPCIVSAEMLGVPVEDRARLKAWSSDFAEMLGNFQHNPERAAAVLASVEEVADYFRAKMRERRIEAAAGLIGALMDAEWEGDRLSEEEIIANCVITMVGGQETTTNLIGNGLLALLHHPREMDRLRGDPSLAPAAVEELLRFESPTQHTARLAPRDVELDGRAIRARQAVFAVMGAANRDPERFPEPDRLVLDRKDNRHVAFGWGPHFCFGAALARLEGQIAIETLLRRMPGLALATSHRLHWRSNLALRGLTALPVTTGDRP